MFCFYRLFVLDSDGFDMASLSINSEVNAAVERDAVTANVTVQTSKQRTNGLEGSVQNTIQNGGITEVQDDGGARAIIREENVGAIVF